MLSPLNNTDILINKLKTIRSHRLVLVSVISAIILTEIVVAPLSILFHGKITYDYITDVPSER